MCRFHCEVRLPERDESSDHSPDLLGCSDHLECHFDPVVWDHVVGLAVVYIRATEKSFVYQGLSGKLPHRL